MRSYSRNRASRLKSMKRWRMENREHVLKCQRLYQKKNRKKLDQLAWQRNKLRLLHDPMFKLKRNMARRIRLVLDQRSIKKTSKTFEMLQCDPQTLRQWIESKFSSGMGWHNQGLWHIDHAIPCKSAKTKRELIKLFHYTNLQPLDRKSVV